MSGRATQNVPTAVPAIGRAAVSCYCATFGPVAELAYAGDLKSPVPKGTCGFESRPAHLGLMGSSEGPGGVLLWGLRPCTTCARTLPEESPEVGGKPTNHRAQVDLSHSRGRMCSLTARALGQRGRGALRRQCWGCLVHYPQGDSLRLALPGDRASVRRSGGCVGR